MPSPNFTWGRTYVMGSPITGRLQAPVTPVPTTIKPSISGTYGTSSQSCTYGYTIGSTAGIFGGRTVFTSTVDMSARDYVAFQCGNNSWSFPDLYYYVDTFANGGLSVIFFDDSGDWSEFNIFGNEFTTNSSEDGGWTGYRSPGQVGCFPVVLERSRTPDDSFGTLDWSSIEGFEFLIRTTGIADTSSPNIELGSLMLIDKPVQTQGESGDPSNFEFFKDNITAWNSNYHQPVVYKDTAGNFRGAIAKLYEPYYTYRIGDGVTETYFRDLGTTLAPYPLANTTRSTLPSILLEGVDRGIEISSSPTCDMLFEGTIFASVDVDGGEDFVSITGNTSGVIQFKDASFYRKSYISLSHSNSEGVIFDDCETIEIDFNSSITGSIIRNCSPTSKGLYINTAPGNYSLIDVEFKSSNNGYDITIDPVSTGTYVLSGVSIEQGHTLVIRNDSPSIAITVEAPNVAYTTSTAGGTITVVTPTSTAGISAPNVTAGRVQVYNVTQSSEMDNTVTPGNYLLTWVNGTLANAGDVIRFRWVEQSSIPIESLIVATADTTTQIISSPEEDVIHSSYGLDGSTITEFTFDFPNVQFDIDDTDNLFYLSRFYAWYKYNLSSSVGVAFAWGSYEATDTSNHIIRDDVLNVFFDNARSVSARQGDNIVVKRVDGAYPQAAVTSGGGGLGFYYQGIGYETSSGSGLDTAERNKLLGLRDYNPESDAMEGLLTYQQAQRVMLAESAGIVTVSGNDVSFRDQADTKDRIVSTTDSDGQRITVTVDGA